MSELVPEGWELKTLDELCTKITDGEHLKPNVISEGIPFVSAKDLKENGVDFNKKENSFLDIAKRRFSSALTRTNSVDQLIDLTVSLESLFAPTPGEITVRLSNRMATLLAKDDSQREDYWVFVKKVYNLRSGIVHGDGLRNTEINGKKYTLNEILEKLVDLTRQAILIYLKLVGNYSGNNKIHKICNIHHL